MRTGLSRAAGMLVLLAVPALANDSAATLGAGGLELGKSTIRMASEDLFVSPQKVRVRYEFVNDGAKDVETIVAFPLPDIDSERFAMSDMGPVTDDPLNFVGFGATVDGTRVRVRVEQHAIHKDQDVTAQVKAAGVPLNLVIGNGAVLSTEAKQKLIAAGLAEGEHGGFAPLWTVRTKLWWTQRFPAGRTVTIEHRYQPVSGSFFFESLSLTDPEIAAPLERDFCIDSATKSTIRKRLAERAKLAVAGGGGPGMLIARQTEYILTTAKNWNGPIGTFHLTLDKLKPDNVLSLCWSGRLKKSGDTLFEYTAKDFVPPRDIKLLVLQTPDEG